MSPNRTGRTFWYQVFRYTNRDNMGHDEATGPLDIDPKDVSTPFSVTLSACMDMIDFLNGY